MTHRIITPQGALLTLRTDKAHPTVTVHRFHQGQFDAFQITRTQAAALLRTNKN